MLPFLFGVRGDRAKDGSKRRRPRNSHRFRVRSRTGGEYLEDRILLTTYTVDIINFAFSPSNVTINVGDTVHWVWEASDHSTTSVAGSAEQWNSGVNNAGHTFDETFTQTGTFWYYCVIHGYDVGNGTAGGMAGTVTVNAAPTLESIALTPVNPSIAKGLTEQFDAVGTYSDNSTQDLTSQATWASATTSVATVSNSGGSQGLATAVATGTSSITATLDGITGSTVLTVSPAVLQTIAVAPTDPSVAKGLMEQFSATGTYSDESTQNLTDQVTWSSANTAIATITTAGLATADGTGTSTISAELSGISGSTVLTVTPAILQSIAVTPADPSVAKGLTEQFDALGTYSDSSTRDLTNQVTWASATPSVATISSANGSQGLATAVATGTASITAALGAITGSTVLTVSPAVLQAIAIAPVNPSVAKGLTDQFTATGTYSDNSTQDLTNQVTWASATPSVATISNANGAQGLATAVATGTSTITATLGGVSGSTVLTVSPAILQSIAVGPANPTLVTGQTAQFTATGSYSDNSTIDLTSQVTWASATTSVATISNVSGSNGLATAVTSGTASISAALGGGASGSTVLTVSAATLQSITVTPADPTIAAGGSEQFTATGTYSDNSTHDVTSQVTWASSASAVATISNANGSRGLAAAVAAGTATIGAELGGITGSTVFTVSPAVLQSITIAPANPSVPAGQAEQFTATGIFTDNTTQDLTSQVIWASATTAVATISNATGSHGLAAGVATGTSAITATLGGISGSTVLTVSAAVLQSITIAPADPSVAKGLTDQFTATGTFSDNSTRNLTNLVTWSSANAAIAAINAAGLATATGTGQSTISAQLTGVSGSTLLTVTAAVLESIAETPANPGVAKGLSVQFNAVGTYSDNSTQNLTREVVWASATTSVATISSAVGSQGLATAAGVGTSAISATLGGITDSTVLTVTAAALQSIAVASADASIAKGLTDQFTAVGTYSDNSTQDLTNEVTWASATTSVATISSTTGSRGLATASGTGTSVISATLDGVGGSSALTVTPAALQSIVVLPASASIPLGEIQPFRATGTFSDRTTEDLTSTVTWTSSNTAVATISNAPVTTGAATSVGTGSSTITATLDGITGSTVLTVTPVILEMIMVMPANPSLVEGQSVSFMAMGMFSDNSTQDFTNRVTWTSSMLGVASVTPSGVATGLAPGSSVIIASFQGMTGQTTLSVTAPPLPPLVTLSNVSVTLKKHMVTQFTITLSGGVNSTGADSIGTYRLATAGKKGSFTAKNAGIIKLKGAVYDPIHHTIVLTPKKPFGLTKPVQLLIEGTGPAGLEDSVGRLIDGDDNGAAGGNAMAVIRKGGVTVNAHALARSLRAASFTESLVDIVLDQG